MIVWADLETTGLDPLKGSILEIAMIATDDKLVQICEPFVSLVKPLHLRGWEAMDNFVREMHAKNGLLARLYEEHESGEGPSTVLRDDLPRLGDVERAAIEWCHTIEMVDFTKSTPSPTNTESWPVLKFGENLKKTPLGGNTVHFDKRWLIHHMDALEALFSHRIVDVSSFTEEAKRSAPAIYARRPGLGPDGKPIKAHRALDDIRMSIETLKFYRQEWLGKAQPVENVEWATFSEMKSNG